VKQRPDNFEVWIERDEETGTLASLTTMEEDGQTRLVASERFGPFDTDADIASWIWRQVTLALVGAIGV
jgi:hypothetical protein